MKIAVICANGKKGKLIARKLSQEEQPLQPLSVAKQIRSNKCYQKRPF